MRTLVDLSRRAPPATSAASSRPCGPGRSRRARGCGGGPHARAPLGWAWLAALLPLVLAGAPARGQDPLRAEVWIDPASGVDAPGAGAESSPYRTLPFALIHHADADELTIHLRPGRYIGGTLLVQDPVPIPLSAPPLTRRLTVVGPGAGEEPAILESRDESTAFWSFHRIARGDLPTGALQEVRLEGLTFRGGPAAVEVVTWSSGGWEEPEPLAVRLLDCVFEDQVGAATTCIAVSPMRVSVEVRRCRFSRGRGGLSAEALAGASVAVEIVDSVFDGFAPTVAGERLDAALDLIAEGGGEASFVFERNRVSDIPAGLILSTDESLDDRPPVVSGVVRNCVFESTPGRLCPDSETLVDCRLRAAFVLGLRPPDRVDLAVTGNSFRDVAEAVLGFLDHVPPGSEAVLPEDLLPEDWTLEFANNIVWDTASTEGQPSPSVFAELFSGLPPGVRARHDLLPPSWLERAGAAGFGPGHLAEDPRWTDAGSGDLSLGEGSPAIDAGTLLELDPGDLDLTGGCRVRWGTGSADGDAPRVDLGAFEAAGACVETRPHIFLRGDCNRSRELEIADAIATFSFLFLGGGSPRCPDACDANDDGVLDITDGIFTLGYLFLGGATPPPPHPGAGEDPSLDPLGTCER